MLYSNYKNKLFENVGVKTYITNFIISQKWDYVIWWPIKPYKTLDFYI